MDCFREIQAGLGGGQTLEVVVATVVVVVGPSLICLLSVIVFGCPARGVGSAFRPPHGARQPCQLPPPLPAGGGDGARPLAPHDAGRGQAGGDPRQPPPRGPHRRGAPHDGRPRPRGGPAAGAPPARGGCLAQKTRCNTIFFWIPGTPPRPVPQKTTKYPESVRKRAFAEITKNYQNHGESRMRFLF